MIDQFSPFSRRLIAVGLLVLVFMAGLIFVVLPLYSATSSAVSNLQDARFRLNRLEAIQARPAPPRSDPVPPSLYVRAPNREMAAELLIAKVNSAVAGAQVTLDIPVYLDGPPTGQSLVVAVRGTGPSDAVLNLFNGIERGDPAIRFKSWKITATDSDGKTLRFEGVAIAAWAAS